VNTDAHIVRGLGGLLEQEDAIEARKSRKVGHGSDRATGLSAAGVSKVDCNTTSTARPANSITATPGVNVHPREGENGANDFRFAA
jgi:hypothetical protein